MKICKCGKSHENTSKYCSRSCANSRIQTEELKKRKSETVKTTIANNPEWV